LRRPRGEERGEIEVDAEQFSATPMPGGRSRANCWSLNGLAFAVITGIAVYVWFKVPALGVVIGLAMICNLLAAALGGILIPLALHGLKIDLAVASSLFVTTVTDVVGFFSFLSIATFWFGLR
jgi:magnesium transporter